MDFTLSDTEKARLLTEAREAIAARLAERVANSGRTPSPDSPLLAHAGAFVSLHQGGRLRGCIGLMSSDEPLIETVREMARSAAFGDPRFPPLTMQELGRVMIEISVLSPMEECPDPGAVEVGRHGVYLIHKGHSGVFLPQVAPEQGWDRETFLEQLGLKAGLYPEAWREPGARLYTFTAVVFSE